MMKPGPAFSLSIRTKFIVFICSIISVFYLYILYRTSVFDESMILKQAEQQARMLYKQILLTRQWASDHNGLFILQHKGAEVNPYLDLPTVSDAMGRTYFLRNPAMITRELAVYAKRDGLGYFRVTSLKPVNPDNRPDDFEQRALVEFEHGTTEKIDVGAGEQGRVLRFMAPLLVNDSCLGCHARHGYREGDIRGGLSITIPISWADELIRRNTGSLFIIGVLSIILVTITLIMMFETLIVRRINRLNQAMDAFPEPLPADSGSTMLPARFKDELDTVNDNFRLFCDRLNKSSTELLKAKNQAHLSEKMASLGILTAGIAHEVNNPLGGMLNCVKSMRERPEDRELIERYLPLLDKGLRQIEMIMRQLLNFGRTEPLKSRRLDLGALLAECIELLSYKLKNIELRTDIRLSREHLLDAEALKQIVINIGLNAIQAMPKGGRLDISCYEEDAQLVLSFSDTGCGIDPESMPHIFDPFFTTKGVGEGTGLGLAVTYSLVQRMSGKISVESEPGKGSVFTITIPSDSRPVHEAGAEMADSSEAVQKE